MPKRQIKYKKSKILRILRVYKKLMMRILIMKNCNKTLMRISRVINLKVNNSKKTMGKTLSRNRETLKNKRKTSKKKIIKMKITKMMNKSQKYLRDILRKMN